MAKGGKGGGKGGKGKSGGGKSKSGTPGHGNPKAPRSGSRKR